MNYGAVFWDIDGTLYDAEALFNKFALDKNLIRFHYDYRARNLDQAFDDFKSYVDGPYEGLPELMRDLKEEGTLQGIISNGPNLFQHRKIALFDIEDYIDSDLIFISGNEAEKLLKQEDNPLLDQFNLDEMTRYQRIDQIQKKITYKPSPYMFREALNRTGLDPDNCILIGDQPADYAGAKKVGMKAGFIEGIPLWPSPQESNDILMKRYKPDFTIQKGDIKSLRDYLKIT